MGDFSSLGAEVLSRGVGFKVGEGKGSYVRFWYDDWLGRGPLLGVFPRLFMVVFNKLSLVGENYEGEGGRFCVLGGVFQERFASLFVVLANVFIGTGEADRSSESRVHPVSSLQSFSRGLEGVLNIKQSSFLMGGLAPPRVEAFRWL